AEPDSASPGASTLRYTHPVRKHCWTSELCLENPPVGHWRRSLGTHFPNEPFFSPVFWGGILMGSRLKKVTRMFVAAAVAISLSGGTSRPEKMGGSRAESATADEAGREGCCCKGQSGQCCSGGACPHCGQTALWSGEFHGELLAFAQIPQAKEKRPA